MVPPHPPPPPPPPSSAKKESKHITVLLTGYGSFSRIADNPSWAIVSSFLKPAGQTLRFSTALLSSSGLELEYVVTFRAHPEAIRVAYAAVDALVPELWAARDRGEWDYVLHVGVGLEGGFELECRTWEKGYTLLDVDGRIPAAEEEDGDNNGDDGKEGSKRKGGNKGGGNNTKKKGVKMTGVHGSENAEAVKGSGRVLFTALDVPYVTALVSQSVVAREDKKPVGIVPSDDPGMFLCGYIFRTALLEAEKRDDKERKRVAFLHVPPEGKRYGIQTGRDVVLKVVEGMVRDGEGVRE